MRSKQWMLCACWSHVMQNKIKFLKYLVILIGSSWIVWIVRYPILHSFEYAFNSKYRSCVNLRHSYEAKVQTGPLFITLAGHGRLGNWLYAYASLLGIARTNGYIPYLDTFHPIGHTFQVSKLRSSSAQCLLSIRDPMPCGYVEDFNNLPAANISIDGYIQSWKYFQFMEDEIRKEFTFSHNLKSIITTKFLSYVSGYLKEGRAVISIHVRRGDKLSAGAQSLGFRPAPLAYFRSAMHYMARKFPHSVFLVISDDMEWCKQNLQPVILEYFNKENRYMPGHFRIVGDTEPATPVVDSNVWERVEKEKIPLIFTTEEFSSLDLGLLTMANHSIVSVGTFGWWGAWLANGHVVYYKDQFFPHSTVNSQTVSEDFFPPHWVPLSSAVDKTVNVFCYMLSILVFYYLCS